MQMKRGSDVVWRVVLVMCLILLQVPACLAESPQDDFQDGFSGEVVVGGGWSAGRRSQLDVDDDNERLDDLDDRGDRFSEAVPALMVNVSYGWRETGTRVFLGNSDASHNGFTAGISQSLGSAGTLQTALTFARDEVWEDPYLVGVDRDETDRDTLGLELGWESILGTGLALSYGYTRVDVDDDRIGDRIRDLRRDGYVHTLEAAYAILFAERHLITPGVSLELGDLDGAANRYNGYSTFMVYAFEKGDYSFETVASLTRRLFDERHPRFRKTREETEFSSFVTVKRAEPFDFKNFNAYATVGVEATDANINFFDSHGFVVGAGIGYEF